MDIGRQFSQGSALRSVSISGRLSPEAQAASLSIPVYQLSAISHCGSCTYLEHFSVAMGRTEEELSRLSRSPAVSALLLAASCTLRSLSRVSLEMRGSRPYAMSVDRSRVGAPRLDVTTLSGMLTGNRKVSFAACQRPFVSSRLNEHLPTRIYRLNLVRIPDPRGQLLNTPGDLPNE